MIVGDGPTKDQLQRTVRELSLEDVVSFGGEVSDQERTALLHACDVFVMPNSDILRPDGVLALHVTNQYLDLAPVVEALAHDLDLAARMDRVLRLEDGHLQDA